MDIKRKIRIIIYLAFIILLLILAYFIFWKKDNNLFNFSDKEQKVELPVVENKIIKEETGPFKIEINYPFVSGFDDFNQRAERLINNKLEEFKRISLENDQAIKEIDPENYAAYPREYPLVIGYETGLVDGKIISIVFNIYSFTGGAHGASDYATLNYDIENKKEIKLADIFEGQGDYTQKISDYCIPNLKQQITERTEGQYSGWVEEGAGPQEQNFSVFMIKENSIVFYFAQYQVAAYAIGDFKVEMPR